MPRMAVLERAFCRSAPWSAVARRLILPWALADYRLEGPALEVGAGSGSMAEAVASTHPDVRLTVTDLDPAMVASMQRRLARHPNVGAQLADMTALPFADESFAVVTSFLMLHHVIDWRPALAEAHRVLRPGGALLGYDLTSTRLARAVHVVDHSPHHLIAPEELKAGLLEVGFKAVEVAPAVAGHVMRFRAQRR